MPVYLIHFDQPYKHARHYLGWTEDLSRRLEEHTNGNGSNLVHVISEAGITWKLARVWENAPRGFEMHLKKHRKNTPKLCPICNPDAYNQMQFEKTEDYPVIHWENPLW